MEASLYDYYSHVTPKAVEWLWYPYIPLGKLTVIQGDPGDGKSTFVLNVIAQLTSGQPMPNGYVPSCSRIAVYQCAEDGIADTIKPRLEQAGANCDQVAYIIALLLCLDSHSAKMQFRFIICSPWSLREKRSSMKANQWNDSSHFLKELRRQTIIWHF